MERDAACDMISPIVRKHHEMTLHQAQQLFGGCFIKQWLRRPRRTPGLDRRAPPPLRACVVFGLCVVAICAHGLPVNGRLLFVYRFRRMRIASFPGWQDAEVHVASVAIGSTSLRHGRRYIGRAELALR